MVVPITVRTFVLVTNENSLYQTHCERILEKPTKSAHFSEADWNLIKTRIYTILWRKTIGNTRTKKKAPVSNR